MYAIPIKQDGNQKTTQKQTALYATQHSSQDRRMVSIVLLPVATRD
jgi:hypothetical protein